MANCSTHVFARRLDMLIYFWTFFSRARRWCAHANSFSLHHHRHRLSALLMNSNWFFSDNGIVAEKIQQSDLASPKVKDKGLWRDLVAYWIFGLCNNFGYVVMLTAAHDIIKDLAGDSGEEDGHHADGVRPCNVLSTGAILLADVVPGLVIKSLSPFLPFWAK